MKLRPIGERALVEPVEHEEKAASGFVLPETAEDRRQTARVAVAGDLDDGGVNEDELVVFARYSGTSITLDEEDLLGIVEG